LNPKIKKVIDEIKRTKAKILELQTLLPELERKRIDMENTEIIKLVRSADIQPAELPAFLESLKAPKASAFASAAQHGASHATATATEDSYALGGEHERDDGGDYDDDEYPDDEDDFSGESQSEN